MRALRARSGWTVIELMLVAVLLVVVMGGTLSLLDTTAGIVPQESERAHAVREAQVGLARMTRELRQATRLHPSAAPASKITVDVPVAGVSERVTYDCSAGRCERSQLGSSVVEVVIDRVLNPSAVFTPTGDNYFEARIEVPASGERSDGLRHRIVLDDGFFMRNIR